MTAFVGLQSNVFTEKITLCPKAITALNKSKGNGEVSWGVSLF